MQVGSLARQGLSDPTLPHGSKWVGIAVIWYPASLRSESFTDGCHAWQQFASLYVLLLISAHTFDRNMRLRHINLLIILFLIRWLQAHQLSKSVLNAKQTRNVCSASTIDRCLEWPQSNKVAKIRNRYNQVPHLTQDTNGKVTNSQKTPQTRAKRSALSQQVTTKHI